MLSARHIAGVSSTHRSNVPKPSLICVTPANAPLRPINSQPVTRRAFQVQNAIVNSDRGGSGGQGNVQRIRQQGKCKSSTDAPGSYGLVSPVSHGPMRVIGSIDEAKRLWKGAEAVCFDGESLDHMASQGE